MLVSQETSWPLHLIHCFPNLFYCGFFFLSECFMGFVFWEIYLGEHWVFCSLCLERRFLPLCASLVMVRVTRWAFISFLSQNQLALSAGVMVSIQPHEKLWILVLMFSSAFLSRIRAPPFNHVVYISQILGNHRKWPARVCISPESHLRWRGPCWLLALGSVAAGILICGGGVYAAFKLSGVIWFILFCKIETVLSWLKCL